MARAGGTSRDDPVAVVSVIVRAKDKAETIPATLDSIRRQSVGAEIVVVDSGSTDGTREIAAARADRVVDLPPERFTYGHALNVGAAAAAAPVHVALSAHCTLPHDGWIARALELYADRRIAAVNGDIPETVERPGEIFRQSLEHARAHPWIGFTNHASSWRAEVWRRHPFDEQLGYAEDKEWALRVLADGWTIAYDARLHVPLSHQWDVGVAEWASRQRRSAAAIASFSPWARYGPRELAVDWWRVPPGEPAWRRRLNPARAAGLAAKYRGFREGRGGV